MTDLPEFRHPPPEYVEDYALRVFGEDFYLGYVSHSDGHYRVFFDKAHFMLAEDRTEPSRSQWNTLKKRLKRVNRGVFVFKQYGEDTYKDQQAYYLDIGFFLD